uniref:hypothetical protein n=1 Tax=Methanobrevibacter sp. TaxID=66852 RepID=UPI00388E1226
ATGFLTTVFTCNPVIGMAVGASIGACFGLFAAAETIESSYDVNFNRLSCTISFVSVGIITGALGGYVGNYAISQEDWLMGTFEESFSDNSVKTVSMDGI